MSTKIKIENQTEVPVLVALFEQPKCNDHPTRSAVLKPGESCDWGSGSVPLGNYQCYAKNDVGTIVSESIPLTVACEFKFKPLKNCKFNPGLRELV